MASHGRRFASKSTIRHKKMKVRQRQQARQLRKQVREIQKQQKVVRIKYDTLQHSVYKNSPAARALNTKTAFQSKRKLMQNGYNRETARHQLNTYNNRISSTKQGVRDIWDRSAQTIIKTKKGKQILKNNHMSDDEFLNRFHKVQANKASASGFWSLYSKISDVMQLKGVTATSPQVAQEALITYGNGESETISDDVIDDLMGTVNGIVLDDDEDY